MFESYHSTGGQEAPTGRLSGYSVNSPPLQRKSTLPRSPDSESAGKMAETTGSLPASPVEVTFRRIGGNRRARESFNRLSVEFDADAPEDAKTYTERFASAKALFENMTRSHMPSIESPNRTNVTKVPRAGFKNRSPNGTKVSPPVPMKPVHLTSRPNDSFRESGSLPKTEKVSPIASNLNRLLPDSPKRSSHAEGTDNLIDNLGPRLSPEGQADPSPPSSTVDLNTAQNEKVVDGSAADVNQKDSPVVEKNLDAEEEEEEDPYVSIKAPVLTQEETKDTENLHPDELLDETEPPPVYSGSAEEGFIPSDLTQKPIEEVSEVSSEPKPQKASDQLNGELTQDAKVNNKVNDDKDDTETEIADDSSVNEDEYDLGNELTADYNLPKDDPNALIDNTTQSAAELASEEYEKQILSNVEAAEVIEDRDQSDHSEGPDDYEEEDEEVNVWRRVYEGLQEVDEMEGLPPPMEEDLYVIDDEITRKKKVVFSTDNIKVSYTYSLHDLDRRNDQIDPVGASAEYELEKRIDKMTLFEVELDKSNTGLGLSIIGMGVGADAGVEKLGIFIKTMNPNGAAAQSGKICVGDMIIEVNGQSLVGVTQVFAATVLKSTESVVKFLLGREQENGEISRLLHDAHAEEQAASAAQGINSQQQQQAPMHGHAHSNTASSGGSAGDSESFSHDAFMNESVEDLLPTAENFEKLKMMYQYSENTRSLFQEEREQALMQLDRIQSERDELGGRVIPRLEAQIASMHEQLQQTQARRDELEKKYMKAKRLIKDLTNESNEMKEHVRSVKEQMSSMKEEFQEENFTLHEKIALLEAQLLQQTSAATQLHLNSVGNANNASSEQMTTSYTTANDDSFSRDSTDAGVTSRDEVFNQTPIGGIELESAQAKDRHTELMTEARTRSSYVESQFNQVIQLLETPPRSFHNRYDDGMISDDDLLDNDRHSRNSNSFNPPPSGTNTNYPRPVSTASTASYTNSQCEQTPQSTGRGDHGNDDGSQYTTPLSQPQKSQPSSGRRHPNGTNVQQLSSKSASSANEKIVSRKLRFFKNTSIPENDEKELPTSNGPQITLPPLKLKKSASQDELTSPNGQNSAHDKGLDLSLLKYKARLVKSSRLMARRLLPSRHRNSSNRTSAPNQRTSMNAKQDNSDTSSTGSGSGGGGGGHHSSSNHHSSHHQYSQNKKKSNSYNVNSNNYPGVDASSSGTPLGFHHEFQGSSNSSSRSFAEKLRSSFTKQGKYVVNAGPTSPPAGGPSAVSTPQDNNYRSSFDMDTGDYPPYDPRKASADSFNDSDQPASEASNPTSTASSVSQNSLLSSSATGGVIKTDPKQMLLKLNLLKLYPLFQKHHIDGSNLHELASSDKLKDMGVVDKKDRELIKQHIKEMNKIIHRDSKLKSKVKPAPNQPPPATVSSSAPR